MPINDPNRPRSSGEWSPFVTVEAFGNFLLEFRDKYGHLDKKLDEITQRIAKGDTKFEMLQRDAAECKLKQGEHSTLIKALTNDGVTRKATEAAIAAQPKPSYFMATILPIILSVLIPASMLLVYKLVILDAKTEDKKAEDKTETHPAHHVP